MITWRVINSTSNPLVIEILQRHTWSYTWYPCTAANIAAGNFIIGTGTGSGNITCALPCPLNSTVLTSVATPCTGSNTIENYSTGEGRFNISSPSNNRFRVLFAAGNWFTLVTGGLKWSVCTEINTYKRPSGRYNQAPIVTMLPIMRLRQSLTYFIKINVADNDFDQYTCIWSNSTQECADICRSALSLPASTYLNETSCVLRFTPATVGYYAMAITVLDFENDTSTTSLSRVPIQFIFNVWSSNATCTLPPIYIGDTPADQCIFVEPDQVLTMLIRIRVQCSNATLANIIGVYPTGFTQSNTTLDPYDPTINVFKVYYTANANQVGQNLFCFAGVDSIGNQGDSTCLRLTVQVASDSLNTLYVNNATHYPLGLVSKYQSNWTLLYPAGLTYTRPTTDAYIRFRIQSTQQDFVSYNVATQTDNIDYRSDRLVITSNVIFAAGVQYFISIDAGVFLPIANCLRDSMGITDATFWPFETASEPSTSSTTSTTSISSTTTVVNRTVPTIHTISTTLPTTITKQTTLAFIITTRLVTTVRAITPSSVFPVGGIVGIIISLLILFGTILASTILLIRRSQMNSLTKSSDNLIKYTSVSETAQQYKLTTRTAAQAPSKAQNVNVRDSSTGLTTNVHQNLVSIEC